LRIPPKPIASATRHGVNSIDEGAGVHGGGRQVRPRLPLATPRPLLMKAIVIARYWSSTRSGSSARVVPMPRISAERMLATISVGSSDVIPRRARSAAMMRADQLDAAKVHPRRIMVGPISQISPRPDRPSHEPEMPVSVTSSHTPAYDSGTYGTRITRNYQSSIPPSACCVALVDASQCL
jgi:hypothetical protein